MLNNIDIFEESEIYDYKVSGLDIDISYSTINKIRFPQATEDDFYIRVFIWKNETDSDIYRISLEEPKYIYNSDPIPNEYRKIIINDIYNSYRFGLEAINKYMYDNLYDLDRSIPDYNKL